MASAVVSPRKQLVLGLILKFASITVFPLQLAVHGVASLSRSN